MGDKHLRLTIELVDDNYPNYKSDKYVYETKHIDTGLEVLLDKLYGMFVGMTYHPETVGRAFKEKGEEILEGFESKKEDEKTFELEDV